MTIPFERATPAPLAKIYGPSISEPNKPKIKRSFASPATITGDGLFSNHQQKFGKNDYWGLIINYSSNENSSFHPPEYNFSFSSF